MDRLSSFNDQSWATVQTDNSAELGELQLVFTVAGLAASSQSCDLALEAITYLDNSGILQSCDYHLRSSLTDSAKKSQWGNHQSIRNANHMTPHLLTP